MISDKEEAIGRLEPSDSKILELAIRKLSAAFDAFIDECLDNGEPTKPSIQAIMKARGCLPPLCKHAFRKKHHLLVKK